MESQQEQITASLSMKDIEDMVFQGLGEASMCWGETPKGVFDGERAKRIGDDLMSAIKRREAEVLTRASLSHYMRSEPIERDTHRGT